MMNQRWEPTTLGHAIMQLLQRAPLSGYDLKKRLAPSPGFAWYAQDSQIYPQLRQLEAHAYIASEVQPSAIGPDRRVYALQPPGEAALRAWLAGPFEDTPAKSELLLRIWSLDLVPSAVTLALLHAKTAVTQERLRQLELLLGRLRMRQGPPETAADARNVGVQLCLEHDIAQARSQLAWLERSRSVVEARAATEDAEPATSAAG